MSRPRIRTIKPELPQDEKFGSLSRDARLLFIELITMADDEGRLRATPTLVIGHCFPYDPDVTAGKLKRWLDEIERESMILRYEEGGRPYIAFRHFKRHQQINKPRPSVLPPPPSEVVVRENSVRPPVELPEEDGSSTGAVTDDYQSPPRVKEGKGKEGKGNPQTPETNGTRVVRFDKQPVPPGRLDLAERLLVEFNEQAGTGYGAYSSNGKPSENLIRIIGALTRRTDVTFDQCAAAIRWQLAAPDPFWRGAPHCGVVFGPGAFDSALESARTEQPQQSGREFAQSFNRTTA